MPQPLHGAWGSKSSIKDAPNHRSRNGKRLKLGQRDTARAGPVYLYPAQPVPPTASARVAAKVRPTECRGSASPGTWHCGPSRNTETQATMWHTRGAPSAGTRLTRGQSRAGGTGTPAATSSVLAPVPPQPSLAVPTTCQRTQPLGHSTGPWQHTRGTPVSPRRAVVGEQPRPRHKVARALGVTRCHHTSERHTAGRDTEGTG